MPASSDPALEPLFGSLVILLLEGKGREGKSRESVCLQSSIREYFRHDMFGTKLLPVTTELCYLLTCASFVFNSKTKSVRQPTTSFAAQ